MNMTVPTHSTAKRSLARGEPALIRGSLFQSLPSFVRSHFGESRWSEFLQRIDPSVADTLGSEMSALAWYPFLVVASAADTMVAMSNGSGDETLRKFAIHNLDRATNLIFRAIFKVGSPEFMVGKSDQVWKKYYSTGYMTVEKAVRGNAVVRLHEFPDITPNYTRVVLFAIESVIVKAGGRTSSREVTRNLAAGDPYTEFTYAWTT